MAGIAEVAALAGVSKATASRALSGSGYVSEATRAKVTDAAEQLQYVPSTHAVGLATGRTKTIGVLMPLVSRWFFAEVLEGIQAALLERGMDLTLYQAPPGTPAREKILRELLVRKRIEGLIAVGLEPTDPEWERLTALQKPLVAIVGSSPRASIIAIDDDHAVRRATQHLIALGHRRIAFIGGDGRADSPQVDRNRFAGYRDAMADAGLADSIAHIHSPVSLPGGYSAAVDALDARDRPTGLVAVCDEVAVGAIIAARRLGIQVPGELSVTGIDDHEYAEMFSLTTLEQRPRLQGAAAVDLLLDHIDDPGKAAVTVQMKARLIVRGSTQALGVSAAARAARP